MVLAALLVDQLDERDLIVFLKFLRIEAARLFDLHTVLFGLDLPISPLRASMRIFERSAASLLNFGSN